MKKKAKIVYTVTAEYEYDSKDYDQFVEKELKGLSNRDIAPQINLNILDDISTRITKSTSVLDYKTENIGKPDKKDIGYLFPN